MLTLILATEIGIKGVFLPLLQGSLFAKQEEEEEEDNLLKLQISFPKKNLAPWVGFSSLSS